MNRTRLVSVLLLMGSLGAAQNTAGGAAEIEQLQVKRDGSDVTIQVVLTGTVKPTVETAINPDRLVLVLPGTISDAKQKHFPLDANGVLVPDQATGRFRFRHALPSRVQPRPGDGIRGRRDSGQYDLARRCRHTIARR